MTQTVTGGCHCGAVRYQAEVDLSTPVNRCNCTMCTKASLNNITLKPDAFKLLSGADQLVDYVKQGHPNHFPFCKTCGIHVHCHGDIPELGGELVSVNALTLDDPDLLLDASFIYWDGRHENWHSGPRDQPWRVKS